MKTKRRKGDGSGKENGKGKRVRENGTVLLTVLLKEKTEVSGIER